MPEEKNIKLLEASLFIIVIALAGFLSIADSQITGMAVSNSNINTIKSTGDSFVYSAQPTLNKDGRQDLQVGNYKGKLRTLLYFDVSRNSGKSIKKAEIRIYNYKTLPSSQVSTPVQIGVYKIKETGISTATWNSAPDFDAAPLATKEFSNAGWYAFDVTGAVQGLTSINNYGFMLKALDENVLIDKLFYASERYGYEPQLVVEYEENIVSCQSGEKKCMDAYNTADCINSQWKITPCEIGQCENGMCIETPAEYCGNRRCAKPMEDSQNCPQDCGSVTPRLCEETGGDCISYWNSCAGTINSQLKCSFLKRCCMPSVPQKCTDSDNGVNPFVKGSCQDSKRVIISDYCLSSDGASPLQDDAYVAEAFCLTDAMIQNCKKYKSAEYCNNLPNECYQLPLIPTQELEWTYFDRNEKLFCPNGCKDGACINTPPPPCTKMCMGEYTMCLGNTCSVISPQPGMVPCELDCALPPNQCNIDADCISKPAVEVLTLTEDANLIDNSEILLKINSKNDTMKYGESKQIDIYSATFNDFNYYYNATIDLGKNKTIILDQNPAVKISVLGINYGNSYSPTAAVNINGESKSVKQYSKYIIGGVTVYIAEIYYYVAPMNTGAVRFFLLSSEKGTDYSQKPIIFVTLNKTSYGCTFRTTDFEGNKRQFYDCNANYQAETTTQCTDSDSGLNYNVKGTTVGIAGNNITSTDTDFCSSSSNLVEWFCSGVYRTNTNYACPYGCLNGACLAAPTLICADSDGGKNYNVRGTVTYGQQTFEDNCISEITNNCPPPPTPCPPNIPADYVVEYFCDNNTAKSETHACGPGIACQDGACINTPPPPCTKMCGGSYKTCTQGGNTCSILYIGEGIVPCSTNCTLPPDECSVDADCATKISIITPPDGFALNSNFNYEITWTSSALNTGRLRILFYNGTGWQFVAWNLSLTQTSYVWKVPDIECSNCMLRVGSYTPSSSSSEYDQWIFYDNATFSIKNTQMSCGSAGGTCVWFLNRCMDSSNLGSGYKCPLLQKCCMGLIGYEVA
jgi:hypothetical protein